MNRVVSLASYGLIAAGLAIMPISAFAGSTTGSDAKTSSNVPVVTSPSGAHAATSTTGAKPATTAGKEAPKADAAKPAPAAPAKVSNAPASSTTGAKAGS